MTNRSRVVGILESDGIVMRMRYRASDSVSTGDTIITSGLGGVFPKGLFVGAVVRTLPGENPLFSHAEVRPMADLDGMEEGFVMRLSARWAAFRSEIDSLENAE
jgi:rod shape-determining protein MreC